MIILNELKAEDLGGALKIWNDVVKDGIAFPQDKEMTVDEAISFFNAQTKTITAKDAKDEQVVGMYILHPNNVGRCAHICNASYAVSKDCRGKGIGELLVKDCIKRAKECGFKILQFNAVVADNIPALNLYKKLGFKQLGTIPKGFKNIDGVYKDIIPHYIEL